MFSEEEDEEDGSEVDMEVAALFATPPVSSPNQEDPALGRPRRPALRRSHRSGSTGGSPLVGGLPYTGRRFCEYN